MNFSDAVIHWLADGLVETKAWQVILITLVLTHITIASVTIFLHRHQAHRSLDLHPVASHFFRFWLWLTTGQVTKEWAAVHRKHHAKCEQSADPHSPVVHGIKKVLTQGAELYRAESKNPETLARYGHGTPDDWIERNLYTRYSWQGVGLLLVFNVCLFGAIGLTIWAVQMAWIPVTAAGVINGLGHHWGYRNFEVSDASTNVSPWGIVIGGEELHNNHHTYPTSAKLSVRPYEFDIGWLYIRCLQALGLAKVRKTSPNLLLGMVKPVADEQTLEAIVANRYEVMAKFAREMRRACTAELHAARAGNSNIYALEVARRWLHRDGARIPQTLVPHLVKVRAEHPVLDTMCAMRDELRLLWSSRTHSREQLAKELQAWCKRAEYSGIAALKEFSYTLRAVRLA